MYKPYHLIGLELGISVLSAALRGEPTGQAEGWRGDVVAVAKRSIARRRDARRRGRLYGLGQARASRAQPCRRARCRSASRTTVPLKRDIAAGAVVRWGDVDVPDSPALQVRRDMERRFAARPSAIAAQLGTAAMEYRQFGRTDLNGFGDRLRLLGNRRHLRPHRRGRISARCWAGDRRGHHLLRHGGSLWHGRVGRGAGEGARSAPQRCRRSRPNSASATRKCRTAATVAGQRVARLDRQEPAAAAHRSCRHLSGALA